MAGYLFGLNSKESLINCIQNGMYSTIFKKIPPNGIWNISHEGTFADYASMQTGDSVYFFIKRKIYGIGKLVNLEGDCKYLNFPMASRPAIANRAALNGQFLTGDSDIAIKQRFICVFQPYPIFYSEGIDMDDILTSAPNKFKILRAFWKLSFIKFGDEENQAFRDILLQRNYRVLPEPIQENDFQTNHQAFHESIRGKLALRDYRLNITPLLSTISDGTTLRHEMAIEADLIFQLSNWDTPIINLFGHWDYLSHQVVASPFKPVDYMDKIDVFGYSFIPNEKPTIGKYLVIEIKKGVVKEQDLLQLMKYVDWVKSEYSNGDYSMIDAYLVGHKFERNCINHLQRNVREILYPIRPAKRKSWCNVKLVEYSYNERTERIDYEIVADAN